MAELAIHASWLNGSASFQITLEVTVNGAPPLNVRYGEVGLKESDIVGVDLNFPHFPLVSCCIVLLRHE